MHVCVYCTDFHRTVTIHLVIHITATLAGVHHVVSHAVGHVSRVNIAVLYRATRQSGDDDRYVPT